MNRAAVAGWIIVALGAAILVAVLPYAVGLLGAGVLWVICEPAHRRLTPALGRRRAAALVLAGALLLILVPVGLLVTVAMQQAPGIVQSLRSGPIFEWLGRLRIGGVDVGEQIAAAGGTIVTWVSRQALQVFGGVTRTILNTVIAFFGLYYLLVAPPGTWEAARAFLPFTPGNSDLLRARFQSVTQATLLGIALTATLQGTLIGVGFQLVGLPNALFWGMMTGIASVIPVLGSGFIWLPAVVILLLQHHYVAALVLALIGAVVVSNIDNVVRMVVFKRVSDIHPMITLVGAFAGVTYMGLFGVLLGPLAIVYLFELLRVYRSEHGPVAAPSDVPAHPERERPAPAGVA